MPDIDAVQEAMHTWEEAHAQLRTFFEHRNIMSPECWEPWISLVRAETLARTRALSAINTYRAMTETR
jgi:hypothetical protein